MQSKPIQFETYAFTLKRSVGVVSVEDAKELWRNAEVVKDGIGVYLIGVKNGTDLTPWYVGKTDEGFKKRFDQHLRGKTIFERLYEHSPEGDLVIVLIARATSVGRLKKARKKNALTKTKALKSIDRLEFDLIRACHAKNGKLINKSNRVFQEGFSVPGFSGPREKEDKSSAKTLRHLLKATAK